MTLLVIILLSATRARGSTTRGVLLGQQLVQCWCKHVAFACDAVIGMSSIVLQYCSNVLHDRGSPIMFL